MQFAALHMSPIGTKRTYRGKRSLVRFWSEADMPWAAGACRSQRYGGCMLSRM